MLISTTDSIDGKKIEKVLGVVHASSIRGTTWTKDIISRVTDIFGGKSKSYEKDLDNMVNEAMNKLIDIASRADADGVVGVKVSLSTIPTKSFGFFLCTAVGTAVKFREVLNG